jgi:hypothetical protein
VAGGRRHRRRWRRKGHRLLAGHRAWSRPWQPFRGIGGNIRRTWWMPGWLNQPERSELGGSRQRYCRGRGRITITVFARCLLVCPGTGQHDLTSAGTETGLAVHNPALRGTESTDLIAGSGLSIRGRTAAGQCGVVITTGSAGVIAMQAFR